MKLNSISEAGTLIKSNKVFKPDLSNKAAYDKNYSVYKRLYKTNKESFRLLNG